MLAMSMGPPDDDWSLPEGVQPQDNYTQGTSVAARFLLWLEQHTRLDIVDQLNHALQTRQPFSAVFHRLTHHTVDQLWSQYKKQPISRCPHSNSTKPSPAESHSISPLSTYNRQIKLTTFTLKALPERFCHASRYHHPFLVAQEQASFSATQSDTDYWGAFVSSRWNLPSGLSKYTITSISPAIKAGYNQTNRLAIMAQKHTIYLYINSQFITQVDDKNLTSGTVGVMTSSYSLPTDVQFEKVQVF